MVYTGGSWTDERIEELKARWNAGESASAVATAMRVTRNAVIAKVNRLRQAGAPLRARSDSDVPRSVPRPKPEPRMKAAPKVKEPKPSRPMKLSGEPWQPGQIAGEPQPPTVDPKQKAFAPLPETTPLPLMDRPHNGCSWPVGEDDEGQMLVCCAPVAGRWCFRHEQINRAGVKAKATSGAELERSIRRYL